jgi:hypothetical protein
VLGGVASGKWRGIFSTNALLTRSKRAAHALPTRLEGLPRGTGGYRWGAGSSTGSKGLGARARVVVVVVRALCVRARLCGWLDWVCFRGCARVGAA